MSPKVLTLTMSTKTLITMNTLKSAIGLVFFLTVSFALSAQSSNEYAISAGVTFNKVDEIDAGVGYFVSGNVTGKLNSWLGYLGSLRVSNYHQEVEKISVNYYSLDPTFAFSLHPAESFSFLAGFTSIYFVDAKIDGEDADISKFGGVYFATGFNFNFTERFGILGTYNIPFEKESFDWTAQLGLTYKF